VEQLGGGAGPRASRRSRSRRSTSSGRIRSGGYAVALFTACSEMAESHPGVSDGSRLMPSSQWGGVARAIPAR
jgi:hypothetical protein